MRALAIFVVCIGVVCIGTLAPVKATTLQQLSLDEMAERSTSIIRARVLSARAIQRGGDIYTVYRVAAVASLKTPHESPSAQSLGVQEVAVPGGAAAGIRQVMPGAPALRIGGEYVMFLWTSRSGLTQITGLSQGLFSVEAPASGSDVRLTRVAAGERMLDGAGRPVHDAALTLRWTELQTRVRQALQSGAAAASAGSR